MLWSICYTLFGFLSLILNLLSAIMFSPWAGNRCITIRGVLALSCHSVLPVRIVIVSCHSVKGTSLWIGWQCALWIHFFVFLFLLTYLLVLISFCFEVTNHFLFQHSLFRRKYSCPSTSISYFEFCSDCVNIEELVYSCSCW